MAEATAICAVKGGPDYEIQLSGQASLVQYKFSEQKVNFGYQVRINQVLLTFRFLIS